MRDQFSEIWNKKGKPPSLTSRLKKVGKPSVGLKKQIRLVTKRIEIQNQRINNALKRFEKRDSALFNRVVKALHSRDTQRANVFASELAEIRKVEKMLMHAGLAMESISMRLTTIKELGDVVTVIAPAANVLNNIRSNMSGVFPEASRELENIGTLLGDIVSSSSQNADLDLNIGISNAEAEKILQEAELAAEEKLRSQLPEIITEVYKNREEPMET